MNGHVYTVVGNLSGAPGRGRHVGGGLLPTPAAVELDHDAEAITLRLRRPADVDAWARWLGIPPAKRRYSGAYAAIEFGENVWCHASVVTLTCPAPAEVAP